jgi:hypothetical protein
MGKDVPLNSSQIRDNIPTFEPIFPQVEKIQSNASTQTEDIQKKDIQTTLLLLLLHNFVELISNIFKLIQVKKSRSFGTSLTSKGSMKFTRKWFI